MTDDPTGPGEDAATMTHPIPPIVATAIAFGGGLIAQASPTTNVGAAGLIASISALLVAGFQYFKAILDSRQQARQIEAQAKEIAQLKLDLKGSRDRRHEDASKMTGMLQGIQVELMEERERRARLEGLLGIVDAQHSDAINTNASGLKKIGSALGISVPSARVEPTTATPDPDRDEVPGHA